MSNRKRLFLPGTSLSAPLRGLPPAGQPSCVGQAGGRGPPGGTADSLPGQAASPLLGSVGRGSGPGFLPPPGSLRGGAQGGALCTGRSAKGRGELL